MKWISDRRIWVDSDTYYKLNNSFMIIGRYISRENLLNDILCEWINSGGYIKIGNIEPDRYVLKTHCIWLRVEENLWNTFKYTCSERIIDINVGFRIAVLYYFYINACIVP
jgi:hypothetical protein